MWEENFISAQYYTLYNYNKMKKLKLTGTCFNISNILTREELRLIHGGLLNNSTSCTHSNECSGTAYCIDGSCQESGGSGCTTCVHSNECGGNNYCISGCCAAA